MDKVKYYIIPGEGTVAYIDFVEGLEPGLYDHQGVEYLMEKFEIDVDLTEVLEKLRRYKNG